MSQRLVTLNEVTNAQPCGVRHMHLASSYSLVIH
jgi:hypothetical protein